LTIKPVGVGGSGQLDFNRNGVLQGYQGGLEDR
jgi:hypothetical protein